MKLIATIIILFSIQARSQGAPFYTDLNGIRYYCQPTQTPPANNGDSIDCIERAYSGPFNKQESELLCQGAQSIAPAECALKAYAGPFNKAESIDLCKDALTSGPADCANLAYSGPFTKSESLTLCGHRAATVETANCALKAYAGPYSKEDSIRLCKLNTNNTFRAITQNLSLKNTNALNSKMKLVKAKEQLAIAKEKLHDAQIKSSEIILDLQSKK